MGSSAKEIKLEDAIERDLLDCGYLRVAADSYDRELALFPDQLFAFIQSSQPELWAQLNKSHKSGLEQGVLDSLIKSLAKRGALDVLRHGFKFYGKKIDCAYFQPAHGLNPETLERCAANRFGVSRQVYFNPDSKQSIDTVLSLNGLPIVTVELKNSLTGQTVADAMKQYRTDRDPRLPLFRFKKRALVHFAVDTDQVYMTTRLAGMATRFLPFNKGEGGGAGNPAPQVEGYKTGYLWRDVLIRESLLDIVGRFLFEELDDDGRRTSESALIFPRYHQLDVVRELELAARDEGAGNHYLIQHSAGSGKSNSIAWVAHRLQSLHDDEDNKVFDSVVVITDRRILDKQLQDTIYQIEHKEGVVARIDKNSAQLATELENATPIIITTLQKFPFVTDKIGALPGRRYAVIIDEAHSSQSGESAATMRGVLAGRPHWASDAAPTWEPETDNDDGPTYEDEINAVMTARGRQPNLSTFAFTATPKAKTLEVFGQSGVDGKPLPFHLYSMRQAIEEGFILDVLLGYTTYKTYYKLVTTIAEDTKVKKKEAVKALARFMSLHPHNVAQKVEVMIEHYRSQVRGKLGGRAKAMVVTGSRLHAVRYKLAFDKYIRDKGYADLQALVAFSGTVVDPDTALSYTEVKMNDGISESELPRRFESDDYQVLLVANKYQTGFDQPLLCAMYVDKRLSGLQAVQTLSRLNRTYRGKETFVLDFVNEADDIQAAFQPYYEQTTVAATADPHQLYDLQHDLDSAQIWAEAELEAFARVFYRPKDQLTQREHEEMHRHLDPARDRWVQWGDEEAREKWRAQLGAFVKLYAFLSQIMPFTDRDLEIRYSFGRMLLLRLPRGERDRVEIDGVDLEYYRLTRTGSADIVLDTGEVGEVRGPTAVGTRQAEDEEVALKDIINVLNERFGTDFTEADKLLFDQIVADGKSNETVKRRARANSFENFALSIKKTIQGLMIDRIDRNQDIVSKYLNEEDFGTEVFDYLARRIFDDLNEAG
jgi:type I restriction enzyme R subunit